MNSEGTEKFDCEKLIVKYMKVWNDYSIDNILALYSDDTIYIHPGEELKIIKGKDNFRKYLQKLFDTYPYHKLFLASFARNNKTIMIEWKVTSVFSGHRYNITNDGTKVDSEGVDVLELGEDNLIRMTRTYYGNCSIKQQLIKRGG